MESPLLRGRGRRNRPPSSQSPSTPPQKGATATTYVLVLASFVLIAIPMVVLQALQFSKRAAAAAIQQPKSVGMLKTTAIHTKKNPREQAILEGRYFLVELNASTTNHNKIWATFCPLDWRMQKQNVGEVPTYEHIIDKSIHCNPHRYTMDLTRIVKKAREYDGIHHNKTKTLQSGLIFDPTHNDTVLSNLLVTEQHRVYNNPQPIFHHAIHHQSTVLEDIIYLMSRSSSPRETHVFFQFQSHAPPLSMTRTRQFKSQNKGVPWIFVYNEPIQVLTTSLEAAASNQEKEHSCLRRLDTPPPVIVELLKTKGTVQNSDNRLDPVQFCAAFLVRERCSQTCERAVANSSFLSRAGSPLAGGSF